MSLWEDVSGTEDPDYGAGPWLEPSRPLASGGVGTRLSPSEGSAKGLLRDSALGSESREALAGKIHSCTSKKYNFWGGFEEDQDFRGEVN